MNPFYEKFYELISQNTPFVKVTMVDCSGSVPQEQGAKILVTQTGLFHGTVGGGKVENRAIEEAQVMLAEKGKSTRFVQWNLNKDVGMTCGGTVKLYFESFVTHTWHIVVFGAGHVGQALIPLLLTLDCHVTCVDPRSDWLDKLSDNPRLTKVHQDNMPGYVSQIEEGAYVALITMGHTTDKPILLEILKTRQFPYLGVIGSKAKAVELNKDIDQAGLPEACKQAFHCPIGLDLGSSHPGEIAVSIAAQLISEREKLQSKDSG